MTRPLRTLTAVAAMLAFLIAQAAAAYACATPAPDPVAMAQMRAELGGEAVPCEKHCASAAASLDLAQPTPIAAVPAIGPAPILRVDAAQPPQAAATLVPGRLSIAGPEPPFGRFTVLRI